MKIPLPPLAEQKRIAAILDKADAIRRKRQEAIALTEEFLRSAFLDMFGTKRMFVLAMELLMAMVLLGVALALPLPGYFHKIPEHSMES